MKIIYQTWNSSLRMLGTILLITPAICLVASAKQPNPKQLAPTLALAKSLDAQTDQDSKVTLISCDDTCCGNNCTSGCSGNSCEAVCCPRRVTKEIKKHCWNVKSKHVCIPGFRWPWERVRDRNPDCGDSCDSGNCCSTPICGRVRCVNTLEKHETTCEQCGYEWEVKYVRPSNQCGNRSKCGCPSCGSKSACCG